jgi:hypothetical protein
MSVSFPLLSFPEELKGKVLRFPATFIQFLLLFFAYAQ